MTAAVITAALYFLIYNITSFKNAAKESPACPDNINKFFLFWGKYQGAGKRPAAQLKNSDALGPKGREQLNKPADAVRIFFFFFSSVHYIKM